MTFWAALTSAYECWKFAAKHKHDQQRPAAARRAIGYGERAVVWATDKDGGQTAVVRVEW